MLINVHSYYSLRYGTMSPESVVRTAREMGWGVLPLTDINTTMAMPVFYRLCKANGIRPLAGVDLREGNRQLAVLIARNAKGLDSINRLLTQRSLEQHTLNIQYMVDQLEETQIIYPLEALPERNLRASEWAGVRPSHMAAMVAMPPGVPKEKLVAMHTATFTGKWTWQLHYHLRAIHYSLLLSRLKPGQTAGKHHVWVSPGQLLKAFEKAPHIMENTSRLLQACSLEMDFTRSSKNKRTFTGHRKSDMELLRKLAYDGLQYRYGKTQKHASKRIDKELHIIGQMNLAAYFLITWDVTRYSMSRGFYHVGRGSGANSIVAYCLRITDVDPLELNLYFERFINPKRSNAPDFDIDYSWKERNEVLDYIFRRHPNGHVALLGAVSTFKERAALRELGKVYGLPEDELKRLSRNPAGAARQCDPVIRRILWLGKKMEGFPNLRTIHSGGVLISQEPLTHYTPLDMPPKGYPVTHWDMYVAEDLGYDKLDILSQRGIAHIRDAAAIVMENRGVKVDVHQVEDFKSDPRVLELLRQGRTMGAFYVESPAMRQLLAKLRCADYKTLVAASSIIRPGVTRSGMMKEYIRRYHRPQSFQYLHPVMKEQLEETFGVMVYQEDVLRVCHHYAAMDPGDADLLRRAMSGKYRSKKGFEKIRHAFFSGAHAMKRPEAITREVWRQITSFAGYSFSKAHSASFAVESFQSLYLKAHYPLEFMVAVLNNMGGFYAPWVYVNEARQQGAHIQPPCVNNGQIITCIRGKTIYLGFVYVHNLQQKMVQDIMDERDKNGKFHSLDDLTDRVNPPLEQLILLIRAGALRFTGRSKQELLWNAHILHGNQNYHGASGPLFLMPRKEYPLPVLEQSPRGDAWDELELLGFPVEMSMFDMLNTKHRGDVNAAEMKRYDGKTIRMMGQLVTTKPVITAKNEPMKLATFMDQYGQLFDTVHFPRATQSYPFRGAGIYLLMGEVKNELEHYTLNVQKMAKLPLKTNPLSAGQRKFLPKSPTSIT